MIWEKMRKDFNWDGRNVLFVAILLLIPIGLLAINQQKLALLSVVSLIPVAIAGVAPKRKQRVMIIELGLFMGIALVIGAVIKFYMSEISAAVFMFGLAFVAALIAAKRNNPLVMTFMLPVVGIGLSLTTIESAVVFMVIIAVNALFAFVVALVFPERKPVEAPSVVVLAAKDAKIYGICFGLAMAIATMLSFFWDHSGWVVGSTGLVMRPYFNKQVSRSLWRAGSIIVSMILISLAYFYLPGITGAGLFAFAALLLLSGFHKSDAYILPFFVTFITFSFMLFPGSNDKLIVQYLLERIIWVCAGISVAMLFGWLFTIFKKQRDKNAVV